MKARVFTRLEIWRASPAARDRDRARSRPARLQGSRRPSRRSNPSHAGTTPSPAYFSLNMFIIIVPHIRFFFNISLRYPHQSPFAPRQKELQILKP